MDILSRASSKASKGTSALVGILPASRGMVIIRLINSQVLFAVSYLDLWYYFSLNISHISLSKVKL